MKLFSLIAAGLCLVSVLVQAAPVADADRIPVDLRRTTLIVSNMDDALSLYRDVLGMKVMYDQVLRTPMEGHDTPKTRRLVLLGANDSFIGALGLLHYVYPEKPEHAERFAEPALGDPILVFNATNLESIWPRIAASKGVEVIDAPELIRYPREGGGEISVMQSMIRDPNGYWIEINHLLSEPAKAADGK